MRLLTQSPWFLAGLLGGLALAIPSAKADSLQSWRFDARQNRLELTTDQGVQPSAQLVANPTRLVIDLPGIRLRRPKIDQAVGGTVQAVRIGQYDAQTTRVVVELAAGYGLDPSQVKVRGLSPTRWTVQLPQPTVDATAVVVPTMSTVKSSTVKLPTVKSPTGKAAIGAVKSGAIATTTPTLNPIGNPAAIATPLVPGDTFGGLVPVGRPLNWLQQRLASLQTGAYSRLGTGMFFLDMETGNFLDINGDKVYPTASIIKLPILIALFQDVDAGKIDLNETLTMTQDVIVGGSGDMQTMRSGSQFSLLETATKMIVISDNTATNMIIKRMGGLQSLNDRFRRWGLQKTALRNFLPDLKGTNTTTPRELAQLLVMLDQQRLLSPRSQAQALDILRRVKNRTLLPVGLGRGATIAHKTGDIGFILGDAGIIQMPTGKRYMAAILVESAYDDPSARDFIQDVSRIVYTYLSQSAHTASVGF